MLKEHQPICHQLKMATRDIRKRVEILFTRIWKDSSTKTRRNNFFGWNKHLV